LSHSLGRGLGCYLNHGCGLISSQLNEWDRVEWFQLDKLKTGCQLDQRRSGTSLRDKVLVSILYTGQSRLGDGSVVSLFVVLDNSNHLVGGTVFTSEQELDVFGRLSSEPLEGKDSLGLSAHQLVTGLSYDKQTYR